MRVDSRHHICAPTVEVHNRTPVQNVNDCLQGCAILLLLSSALALRKKSNNKLTTKISQTE